MLLVKNSTAARKVQVLGGSQLYVYTYVDYGNELL